MKLKILQFILLLIFTTSASAITLICKSETRWGHVSGNEYLDNLALCFDGCDDKSKEFLINIENSQILEITSWSGFFKSPPLDIEFTNSEVNFSFHTIVPKLKNHIDISINRVSGRFHAQSWSPHMKPYDMGESWAGKCKPGKKLF
jgi:hypothetical protein